MADPVLLIDRSEGIATITLNRPDALNALSNELVAALCAGVEELAGADDVEVAILTGAGRAFSAGVDLKELGAGNRATRDAAAGDDSNRLLDAFAAFDRPVIGAINGFAITGGFELALMTDILIASTKARFADTHARVGISPGWGLSQKLPRMIGISRAKELHFTGNFLDAEQAERWGLVNRVVEPEQLMPVCLQLARDMIECDSRTLRTYKRVVDAGYAMNFGDGMAYESRVSREHMAGVRSQDVETRRAQIQARGRKQA